MESSQLLFSRLDTAKNQTNNGCQEHKASYSYIGFNRQYDENRH